jgi:hypothetical protein
LEKAPVGPSQANTIFPDPNRKPIKAGIEPIGRHQNECVMPACASNCDLFDEFPLG